MPYDTYEDEAGFTLPRAVAAVIFALLLIALSAFILGDAPREADEQPAIVGTATLSVRTNNAAEMHRYGMPTKADALEWHMTGQWGFKVGSMFYVYGELPGDQASWDGLYGIDPDNPAFDK